MISITDKTKCNGCYACYSICPKNCISMKDDSEGFWYPEIDKSKCIDCDLCEKVCPELHPPILNKDEPKAYAAYAKDENILLESSSGGMFTLLAHEILRKKGVVFGACFNESFEVIHDYTETVEGLAKFRGSKYVESEIGETYSKAKDFLDNNRYVLFTGTPCQIAGIKSFLKKDYDNLLCVDIICHGVPSPKVWRKYLLEQERKIGSMVKKVSFRHKQNGWINFSLMLNFKNSKCHFESRYKDSMMVSFLKNICLRPSCYKCTFKTVNRCSDITLADFWGIQNVHQDFFNENGVSLVIIQSVKGNKLFSEITVRSTYIETNLNYAIKFNSASTRSVGIHPKRELFFQKLDRKSIDSLVKKYCTDTIYVQCKKLVRKLLSKCKRLVMRLLRKN